MAVVCHQWGECLHQEEVDQRRPQLQDRAGPHLAVVWVWRHRVDLLLEDAHHLDLLGDHLQEAATAITVPQYHRAQAPQVLVVPLLLLQAGPLLWFHHHPCVPLLLVVAVVSRLLPHAVRVKLVPLAKPSAMCKHTASAVIVGPVIVAINNKIVGRNAVTCIYFCTHKKSILLSFAPDYAKLWPNAQLTPCFS